MECGVIGVVCGVDVGDVVVDGVELFVVYG